METRASTLIYEGVLGQQVVVKTWNGLEVKGILYAIERSCHGPMGNVILKTEDGFVVVRGDLWTVITVTRDVEAGRSGHHEMMKVSYAEATLETGGCLGVCSLTFPVSETKRTPPTPEARCPDGIRRLPS